MSPDERRMSDAGAGVGPRQLSYVALCGVMPGGLLAGVLVAFGLPPRAALSWGVPVAAALGASRLVEHSVRGRGAQARVWITGLFTWAALVGATVVALVSAGSRGPAPIGLEGLQLPSALECLRLGALGGYPVALARADAQAALPSRGGVLLLGSVSGAQLLALVMGLREGVLGGLAPFMAWITLGGLALFAVVLMAATACRLAFSLHDLLIGWLVRWSAS